MSAPTPRRRAPPVSRCAIQVPREAVGFIIGRRGETVRRMSARSGAHIAVQEDSKDELGNQGIFNITGTQEQIERARELISEAVIGVMFQPPNPAVHHPVVVSPHSSQATASQSTPRAPAPTPPRTPPLRRTKQSADGPEASSIATTEDDALSTKESNGHTPILPSAPDADPTETSEQPTLQITPVSVYGLNIRPLEMWIPRNMVGMIIGLNGKVIGEMQEKTGAIIVVHNNRKDQDGSKLLTITGAPDVQQEAKKLIEEILTSDPRSRGNPGPSSGRRSRGGLALRRPAPPASVQSGGQGQRQTQRAPLPQQLRAGEPFPAQGEARVITQPFGELVTHPPANPRAQHFNPSVATPPYSPLYRQRPVPLNTRVPMAHPGPRPYIGPTLSVPFVQRGPHPLHYVQPPIRAPYMEPMVKEVRVPTSCVGIVIGKGGETICDLQSRSGAYIKVTPDRDANENDQERTIFISGRSDDIELAHNLLNDIVNEGLRRNYRDGVGTEQSFGEQASKVEAKVEDEGGASGAGASGAPRPLSSSSRDDVESAGNKEDDDNGAEEVATRELQLSITGEYRIVKQPETNYPSSSIMIELSIPNAKVGVIIGKSGQTIRELQQQSGARIVISKHMDTSREDNPRQVTITGPVRFVEAAHALIQVKIRGETSTEPSVDASSPGAPRPVPSPAEVPPEAIQVPPAFQQALNPGMAAPMQGGQVAGEPYGGYQGQIGYVADVQAYQPANIAEMHAMRNRFVQQQQAMQAVQQQVFQQQQAYQYHQLALHQQSQAQLQAQAFNMQNYAAQFGVAHSPFHAGPALAPHFMRGQPTEMGRAAPAMVSSPRPGLKVSEGEEAESGAGAAVAQQPEAAVVQQQSHEDVATAHERAQATAVRFRSFMHGDYSVGFPGALSGALSQQHEVAGYMGGGGEGIAGGCESAQAAATADSSAGEQGATEEAATESGAESGGEEQAS